MKRLLIIHHTGALGGGTKSLIDIAQMLKDEYEVAVCIPKGFNDFVKMLSEKNIQCIESNISIPFLSDYSGRPPFISREKLNSLMSLVNIRKFCKSIMQYDPDAVIFNTIVTSVSAKYLPSSIVKICIDRETMVNPFSKYRYQRMFNKYINGAAFLSEYERAKFNSEKFQTAVIPDSVPVEDVSIEERQTARQREGLPPEKFIILYMGGSSLIKGPDIILKAINSLSDDYYLVIAGNFNKKSISVKSILKHLIIPAVAYRKISLRREYLKSIRRGNVSFVGNVASVSGLINSADAVVFPSVNVHQPRPCIEAGYYEKPVILSDYPETEEYFKDGYNALTFKPKSYKDLVQKIIYAKNNPDKMDEIGRNNRIMSFEKHNFSEIQHTLHQFINDVVSGKTEVNK